MHTRTNQFCTFLVLRKGCFSVTQFFFGFDLFGTHHVHRITHESLIMTYFPCVPLMTCGGLEWEVESTTVTHSSADWWDLLLPLA